MKSSKYLFLRKRCMFGVEWSQDTSFISWDTFRLLRGTVCMPLDTTYKSQDTLCVREYSFYVS